MKKTITIICKIQNINSIERFIEEISAQQNISDTYFSNILTLTDKVFFELCDANQDEQIHLQFHANNMGLQLSWNLNKRLFNHFVTIANDSSQQLSDLINKLSDSMLLDEAANTVHFYFSTDSFSPRLSLIRQNEFRNYFKNNQVIIPHNDSFSSD